MPLHLYGLNSCIVLQIGTSWGDDSFCCQLIFEKYCELQKICEDREKQGKSRFVISYKRIHGFGPFPNNR